MKSYISFQLENLIGKNYFLNSSAKEAFKAYVRAYDSHHLRTIFDISTLDLAKVAISFGFKVPPAVDLKVSAKKIDKAEKRNKNNFGSGYTKNVYSRNPQKFKKNVVYRQPTKRDGRQFAR